MTFGQVFKCCTIAVLKEVNKGFSDQAPGSSKASINFHSFNTDVLVKYLMEAEKITRHRTVTCVEQCKTDQIVKLGLFYFIGPANGYTCTPDTHSATTSLGWLVCFSRASFADPVNLRLRQWDPWKALHGRHGWKFYPSDREVSLMPFKHVWAYGWHFWDS